MALEQPEMDAAADVAIADLKERFSEEEVKKFADWWASHYLKAGYKRIGRALVDITKAKS